MNRFPVEIKMIAKFFWLKLPEKCRWLVLRLIAGHPNIGSGTYLHKTVQILGVKNVVIGKNSVISEGTWINVNKRYLAGYAVLIGNNCFIGRRNFFSSGLRIELGDYVLTTIDCKFIGSTHVARPDLPYIESDTTNTDSIRIGVNCFIGAGASVLGNVSVGYGSTIGAGSVVLKDIPPFSIAVGNPATVVKRYDFVQNKWISATEFSEHLLTYYPTEENYLMNLSLKSPKVFMPRPAAGHSFGNL